ncbi:MAG: HAMP domain-containing histidine kinase [Eubacterium sp.]|nr:HAMP domain-containing histidine kinase [Eubacterium sp.]
MANSENTPKVNNNNRPRRSLRTEITVIFVSLLAFMMVSILIANGLLLNRAYLFRKENILETTFNKFIEANENDELDSDDFAQSMEKIATRNDLAAIVVNSASEVIYSTGAGDDVLLDQFQFTLFGDKSHIEVIEENSNYTIERVSDGMRNTGEFLALVGNLDSDTMVMMRVAMESLQESASISIQFTAVVCVICIILGAIVIYLVTRRITRPIMEMADISRQMADLDFNARYVPDRKRNDEINQLGMCMNELSEALEKTVGELKTANNEMKLDLDRKEQIEMMRTDFLSNVSHELKTPIALIQGYAEGLKESVSDDAESREFYCDVIMDEADKMNRMVKKLLTLNQLEFGANEITMERFDLTALISSVVSSMSIMLERDSITVDFDSARPVYVWADEYKVEEVLTNYMSNAIHHIGGASRIEIKLDQKEKTVRVGVFNTGTPIPDEDLARLWEKFYKVDKSHSRQYGGSGIGLSIVKAIMEAFHQDYGVLNHEDGVEFWFELDTDTSGV